MPFDPRRAGRRLIRQLLQRLEHTRASDAEVEDAKLGSLRVDPIEIADHVRRDSAANLLERVHILGAVNPLSQERGWKDLIDLIILLPPHLVVDGWRDPDPVLEPSLLDEMAPAADYGLG